MRPAAPPQAPVRRQVPALVAGLGVLALGAAVAAVGIPMAQEPGCVSERDQALPAVLETIPELDLEPAGTRETFDERSVGCGEDAAAYAAVQYEGMAPADVVDHYAQALEDLGWTRLRGVAGRDPAPLACWKGTVDGARATLTIEPPDPVADERAGRPTWVVVVEAAHDAPVLC